MIEWRKSSRSGNDVHSSCVEVAGMRRRDARVVGVRDSKDPDGPRLYLAPGTWASLLVAIKAES